MADALPQFFSIKSLFLSSHVLYKFLLYFSFFFQAEDGIRDLTVTGVQTCALPISCLHQSPPPRRQAFLIHRRPWSGNRRRGERVNAGQERRPGAGPGQLVVASGFVEV